MLEESKYESKSKKRKYGSLEDEFFQKKYKVKEKCCIFQCFHDSFFIAASSLV